MRTWHGKSARVGVATDPSDRLPVTLELGEDAARKLALSLARLKQTYLSPLGNEVEEIVQALNYVLVGDPASVAKHSELEASKGKVREPASSNAPDGTWNASTDPKLRSLRRSDVEPGYPLGSREVGE